MDERKGGTKEGRKGEKERKKKILNEYEIHLELYISFFFFFTFSHYLESENIWNIWKMKLPFSSQSTQIKLWLMEKRKTSQQQMIFNHTCVHPFLTQTTDASSMSIFAYNLTLFDLVVFFF